MTQKTIKKFGVEIYSKPPKTIYVTNKTDLYHIDDIWSSDTLDLKDYGPEKIEGYRFVLVVIDNFAKFSCTIPLKNKNALTLKNSFQNILITSKKTKFFLKAIEEKNFTTKFKMSLTITLYTNQFIR